MSTRSTIAVQHIDGTVSSVYCHFDGYLSHNGRLLFKHYATLTDAEALVEMGAISYLDEHIDCPPGHSHDTQISGYSVFYGRDRDCDAPVVNRYANYLGYMKTAPRADYNYLYKDGSWFVEYDRTNGAFASLGEELVFHTLENS